MIKKKRIKNGDKKKIVIILFLIHAGTVYTKRRKKDDTVSSYSYLQYYLYSLLPQILFLRAICEAYTYTFSSNRTRGKARNALQSILPARETSKRLFPPPLLPFSPLSFIRRISLRVKIERGSIEKTSSVKQRDTCVAKIVCVREKEREKEKESIETQSNISHLALRLPLYNCKAALRRKLRNKKTSEKREREYMRVCVCVSLCEYAREN